MRVTIYAILLAAITGCFIANSIARHPLYAFDGYAYGVRAQLDSGIPYERALSHARAVYAPTPAARRPVSRHWLLSPVPQWWSLFKVRVFYPWLGSWLWPRYDFGALFIVSGIAYVAATLCTYGFLLRITRPLFAALIALAVAMLPETRVFGRADLTDMTAYALLVAALWSMSGFARSGRARDLAIAAACCTLVSITRPVPYMLVCAALPLALSPAYRRRGLLLAGVGVALCVGIEIAMNLNHADVPTPANLPLAVWLTARTTAVWSIDHPATWIALGALIVRRREPEALLALGAWLSIVPTMLLNPIANDVDRVIVFPSLICLACGLAYASAILSRAYTATSAAHLSARPGRNTPPPGDRPWSQIRTNVS